MALAHDYLTQRGGAERVALALTRGFGGAPLYVTLYDQDRTLDGFEQVQVATSPLNRLRVLRRYHRLAFPLLPAACALMRVDAEVVLCSTSGWSHAFHGRGRRVVYCHTPARWLYEPSAFDRNPRLKLLARAARLVRPLLIRWDRHHALRATVYIANSSVVQERIRRAYGIDAEVLPPPVSSDLRATAPQAVRLPDRRPFLLCVSRLLPYKNVDAVIAAMRDRDERLVVVGAGPDWSRLSRHAPENVSLMAALSDGEMRWLYENCTGLVAAGYEDFGLAPIEASTFGRPCAVLRAGGFLDTMTDRTAVFFDEATPAAVSGAIDVLLTTTWDSDLIRAHAEQFDEEHFIRRLQEIVSDVAQGTEVGGGSVPRGTRPSVGGWVRTHAPARLQDGLRTMVDLLDRDRRHHPPEPGGLAQRVSPTGVVLSGPFVGTRLAASSPWGGMSARLAGTYELELFTIVESLLSRHFSRVIDIGAAEGYYAIGLARRLPGTLVVAFELDPAARRLCKQNAATSGARNLRVRGRATVAALRRTAVEGSLVICDVEGFELELMDPDAVPSLRTCTLLIELHEFAAPGVTATIRNRFYASHDQVVTTARPRTAVDAGHLAGLSREEAFEAVQEGRPDDPPMQWLFLTPRVAS